MKITKKQLEQLTLDWRQHNKTMKQKHLHDMAFSSIDDYILYRKGQFFKKKDKKLIDSGKVYKSPMIVRRDENQPKIHSLTDSKCLPVIPEVIKEKLVYSGDYIIGIATMHKSNAVPVGRDDDPVSFAKMRR